MASTIQVEDMTTVGALADKLHVPVSRLIAELMKNGVMATVNERIDFDTAEIIVDELGLDMQLEREQAKPVEIRRRKKPTGQGAAPRSPVVTMMGHVDHGKTSLLDALRGGHVAEGEAGGITQHISAYQISHNGRLITFLDTPGHEAFAAIREHGARLTDIAVIVIAADDGIKPQTIEAIRFAKQAGVKILVAINKVDKEGADVNRVKQQLGEQDLLVEEWGGDTVVMEVSAKTKKGVNELLDMILLLSDVEELRADDTGAASGLIIESHIEQGRGPVAHALVETGTLRPGDFVVAGSTYAKVRNLENTESQPITAAGPSTPVLISGFKNLAEFGDDFYVAADERAARAAAQQAAAAVNRSGGNTAVNSSELIRLMNRSDSLSELNIIIKADVQGSLTSVISSLKAMDTDEVAVRVVASGVGAVVENDVRLAQATGAIIYGFNTSLTTSVRRQAQRDKVQIRLFEVIYELIDNVKSELNRLLVPEVVETPLGRLVVRGVFKTTKSEVICGGEVTKGHLAVPALVRIFRGDNELGEAEVVNLKQGPQDVKEVPEGSMCGVSLATTAKLDLEEGDRLELFRRETRAREL